MSRKKLLWGAICALVAVAAASAAFLAVPAQPLPDNRKGMPSSSPNDRSTQPPSSSSSDPVARVGKLNLTREQFLNELERTYGDEYIQEWMERSAVRLEAQALGIDVQHDEIERELERMQSGYDSEEQFYRTMKEQLGLTKEQLRADALHRLQLEKIAAKDIVITDSEIERYIDEHPEQFGPVTEVRFAQIVTETKRDAEEILARLGLGAEFEQLAREFSSDEGTASAGGDVGWVRLDDPFVPSEVMEAAQQLRVGAVSAPISLDDGSFVVITVLGKREIRRDDDTAVREQVRKELLLAKAPPLGDVLESLLDKWGAEVVR